MNFLIRPKKGHLSQKITSELGEIDFLSLGKHIQNLPYKRNSDKENPAIVWEEQYGTCSTKHAFLKSIAEEQGAAGWDLVLGMFKMSGENMPKVAQVLAKNGLSYIPEAHNYLKFHGEVFDFTSPNISVAAIQATILVEISIQPWQIHDFKVHFHKGFLSKWIETAQIPYSLAEIWEIREACIVALQ